MKEPVYKYCGAFGLDILRDLELKITPPNQFNDPFEFTPRMHCSNPNKYAKRLFGSKVALKQLYDMKRLDGGFVGSFRSFRQRIAIKKSQLVGSMPEAMQFTLPESERNLVDKVSQRHGILCLSKRRDSILMWGHYCDKSLGLVIGFDSASPVFKIGEGLQPVDYTNNRVVFDAIWRKGTLEMEQFNRRIVYSKSDEWAYENEMRQMFTLSSLVPKPLKNGLPGYFLVIPAESIASVTMGPRCSPEFVQKVRAILGTERLAHVKLDRAVLNKHNFVLEFEGMSLSNKARNVTPSSKP